MEQKPTYAEQLQTDEWKTRRLQIIRKANYRCEDCSSPFPGGRGLEVHHCVYLPGHLIHEYGDDLLMALCRECHENRQKYQNAGFEQFGKAMRRMSCLELEDAVWTFLARAYLRPFSTEGENE